MIKIKQNYVLVFTAVIFSCLILALTYLAFRDVDYNATYEIDTEYGYSDSQDMYDPAELGSLGTKTYTLDIDKLHKHILEDANSFNEYELLAGYINYNNNLEYHYTLLENWLPAHLSVYGWIPDVLDNNNMTLYTHSVSVEDTQSIVALSKTDGMATSLFFIEDKDVWELLSVDGYRFMTADNLAFGTLIHLQGEVDSLLLYIGKYAGSPAVMGAYKVRGFVSMNGEGFVSIDSQVYSIDDSTAGVVVLRYDHHLLDQVPQGGDINIKLHN